MNDDQILYHYTTAAGLIGLIGYAAVPARIWLTQIQYMNDSSEFYHAFRLAQQKIMMAASQYPTVRRISAGIWGIPEDLTRGPEVGNEVFGIHRHHSFSLSEAPDLLSQWRGYAPDGGYCVGFRIGDLKRVAEGHGLSLEKCVYAEQEIGSRLTTILRDVEQGYLQGEADLPSQIRDQIPEEEWVECTARARLQQRIYPLAGFFKHDSFAEEREWRLVGIIGANDHRVRYRARGADIVPYAEIDISPTGRTALKPCEIIIGPGSDYGLAKHAIMMIDWPQNEGIRISPSASTLRR